MLRVLNRNINAVVMRGDFYCSGGEVEVTSTVCAAPPPFRRAQCRRKTHHCGGDVEEGEKRPL